MVDGKVYVVGGFDGTRDLDLVDRCVLAVLYMAVTVLHMAMTVLHMAMTVLYTTMTVL